MTDSQDLTQWRKQFLGEFAKLDLDGPYEQHAQELRKLIKSGVLKFTDLRDNPKRFFEAHRLLLDPGLRGPGFGIRFTVQFNLFAGSILGLGSDAQVASLQTMQETGTLGCFALTEILAGVNSGLVVNATAKWMPETESFLLNTPNRDAHKNWISQGLTADKTVVMASLILEGKNLGPHAFLIDMRDAPGGKLLPGIKLSDMGVKTTANDLDNARIEFNDMVIPRSSMLSRFTEMVGNKYVSKSAKKTSFPALVGQRLLTGRLAIAQATVVFAKSLFQQTKNFSDTKPCWAPGNARPMLSDMPQLASLYAKAFKELDQLEKFSLDVEARLSHCLMNEIAPDDDLTEAIAVCKVKCVDRSIELTFRLKQEVGSYALMGGSGFEHLDFLQCCKFAEGDSRILMQKMTRDRMKSFQKSKFVDVVQSMLLSPLTVQREVNQCMALAHSLASSRNPKVAWQEQWESVYELADTICARHMEQSAAKRLQGSSKL